MNTLFLAWQDPKRRRWYPVGKLMRDNGTYHFSYTQGALEAKAVGFGPLVAFPDLHASYTSEEVFPLFANRLLPKNRPEYQDFIKWLSLPRDQADPVAILARTGGENVTDTLEVFPSPECDADAVYRAHFFLRGLRHQSPCAIERVESLEAGERLLLLPDVQNPFDEQAILLRTTERTRQDMHMLGYLPRYLASELKQLPWEALKAAEVEVVRVNPTPAPIHFRVLCRLSMRWPEGFVPFSSERFQPIPS